MFSQKYNILAHDGQKPQLPLFSQKTPVLPMHQADNDKITVK
jgi:hypothetical protein